MKKELLFSTAVLTLGTALAFAQAPQTPDGPAAAPERPAGAAPAQRPSAEPGAAPNAAAPKAGMNRAQGSEPKAAPSQAQRAPETKQDRAQKGDAQRPAGRTAKSAEPPATKSSDSNRADTPAAKSAPTKGGSGKGAPTEAAKSTDTKSTDTKSGDTAQRPSSSTTATDSKAGASGNTTANAPAAGNAGGTVSLTAEQRTRVERDVFAARNAPRVNSVNFNINVGVAVPPRIRVASVPAVLIDIHPEWRGYDYFIVEDEIVVIDKRRRIVARVPAGERTAARSGSNVTVIADYTPEQIRELQIVLIDRGFLRGRPDGVFNQRTRNALIAFQRRQGFEPSGQITTQTVAGLGLSARFNVSGSTPGGAGSVTPSGNTASGSAGTNTSTGTAASGNTPGNSTTGQGAASGSSAGSGVGVSGAPSGASGTVGAGGTVPPTPGTQFGGTGTNSPSKADTPAPASRPGGSTTTPGGSSN